MHSRSFSSAEQPAAGPSCSRCVKLSLTPTPQFPLGGDEQTVGGAGPRHHAAHQHVTQAAVAVRTPQVLAQVTKSS